MSDAWALMMKKMLLLFMQYIADIENKWSVTVPGKKKTGSKVTGSVMFNIQNFYCPRKSDHI